ncbi:MAG: hypothetical protein SFX18_09650 [Pirellulales bacterium]|nr:hypothetical protein [Pirellulales bacterium]
MTYMQRTWIIGAAALVLGVALGALGMGWGLQNQAPDRPPSAAMILVYEIGKLTRTIQLHDAGKIAALAAHFPGYERRPTSNIAGGWKRGYEVYFNFPLGNTIRLDISSPMNHPQHWSLGDGDFDVEGDFHQFVLGLGEGG